MHEIYSTTYFGLTINAGCLATSLPAVFNGLEIKWFWDVGVCQRYLHAQAGSLCLRTREADGSYVSSVSGRAENAMKVCVGWGRAALLALLASPQESSHSPSPP